MSIETTPAKEETDFDGRDLTFDELQSELMDLFHGLSPDAKKKFMAAMQRGQKEFADFLADFYSQGKTAP